MATKKVPMTTINSTATRRRGRPEDPRNTELDNLLITIVERYDRITVRGVFYQAVNIKAVEKTENEVGRIGRRLLKLRREGRIAYWRIVDESRIVYGSQGDADLAKFAEYAAKLYRRDYWQHSDCSVQIWVEKRGLAGLLEPIVCDKWGLRLYVAAGQMSETYLYNAGSEIALDGRQTFVYGLTDFDPGGETIFDTLKNGSMKASGGLSRFTNGIPVEVEQIALTAAQVAAWRLPTRPAKKSDKRSEKFIEKHGDISTELDAIEPDRLIGLVEDAIRRHMPEAELERLKRVEEAERELIKAAVADLASDGADGA